MTDEDFLTALKSMKREIESSNNDAETLKTLMNRLIDLLIEVEASRTMDLD